MDWKNTILPQYEIRKSYAQKTAFIEMLGAHFGDRMTVEPSGKLPKTRNIVLGNPERAKITFTAHYDTCARMPFPNFITPKNLLFYLLYQLLLTVVLLAIPFGATYLVATLTKDLHELVGLLLTEVTMFALFAAEFWLLMAGPANPHTVNDNSSGVITVLTLAERLTGDDYAFILFDHEELGLLGSAAYAKAHPTVKKDGLIVNFDCVSDGDTLLLAFSKKAMTRPLYAAVQAKADAVCAGYGKTPLVTSLSTTVYPSDQAAFKHAVAIAALKKHPLLGLYMDKIHTPKDTVYMAENIAALTDLFASAAEDGKSAEETA